MILARAQNTFIYHLPHLAFVGVGLVTFAFVWFREGEPPAEPGAPSAPAEPAPVARAVSRAVAVRGLLALGPLAAAAASGAVIYGVNLAAHRAPGGVVWVHSGLSVLALLLVAYKLREVGMAGLRRGLRWEQATRAGASLLLAALSAPLLVTGVLLLVTPATGSFATYLHLVASAWWTLLLLWHLRAHLGPAMRARQRTTVTRARTGRPSRRTLPPTRTWTR